MISVVFDGSRLPVGSSHSSSFGLLTSARAMAVRCCSPPESSLGYIRLLCERPTRSSTRGTCRITSLRVRAGDLQRERDVFPNGLVGEQFEVLEDDAQVPAQAPECGRACSRSTRMPSTVISPPVGHHFAIEQAKQARFSGSGVADEKDEVALSDLEIDARRARAPRSDTRVKRRVVRSSLQEGFYERSVTDTSGSYEF